MSRAATPRDAAAVILLDGHDDLRMYWVRRHAAMAFQGNFHAFPGGQRDAADSEVAVENAASDPSDTMRVTAVRELFEETGVLLARGAERLDPQTRRELRRRLLDGVTTFAAVLDDNGLAIDAAMLEPAGRWITPPFSPRRFDTWFFAANVPGDQAVELWEGELDQGEWTRPREALARWENGEVLAAPPILHAVRTLAGGREGLADRFVSIPEARGEEVRKIEFRPGIRLYPLRTPTQPPATHTNCYVVGGKELVVIDPGSPYEDEQAAFDGQIGQLIADGCTVREIIATHLHPDHVGGINHLREHLDVPVAAHPITARALAGRIAVDRLIEDGERITLGGSPEITLRAVLTPGHARGHLCFYEERNRSLITGDLIVGLGTVVIDPPEGNMADYLQSLARVRALEPSVIFGAHGPAVGAPIAKIDEYIAHRLEREARIYDAVVSGATTLESIVETVYTDVPAKLHALAARSVFAHLEKLAADGRVELRAGAWVETAG